MEILFRGKVYRKNRRTGEYLDCGWVYGDLHHHYNGSYHTMISNIDDVEMETRTYDVESTTVGQFVGVEDSKGKKIFVGDIVAKEGYNEKEGQWVKMFVVVFDCTGFCLKRKDTLYSFGHIENGKCLKEYVIGNIYDSPELIDDYANGFEKAERSVGKK